MKNQKLPIDDFRAQIINSVKTNSVTIITAETGAGKSTRVPQFLLDEGYSLVVTQPRRLAARSVAKRVAQERNGELGGEIGFRTAYERQDSAGTRCLFCTDGLALVRELIGVGRHHILVLDEVHEWNLNMEVLTAWSKRQIENGVEFKLVIMSATLEADKLSEFFNSAPVISIPGRCFPIEERKANDSERVRSLNILKDVVDLLQEGRNVLVFEPGKAEIMELAAALKRAEGLQAAILPLHGELDSEDQDRVFRSYGLPKCVIATNVAQTSITIEDIDAVVDDGTEKRIELMDGVEGLYLHSISLADRAQRKGRAGRCREGIYIDHCPTSESRREFPLAEIMRVRLDQTVLRLAEAKIDAEELRFFHQPPLDQIHEAKRALRALGCMNESGEVTAIGHQVARLPISVQYGRMIIEAEKFGVVGDIITVAAILEQGGITSRKAKMSDGSEEDGNDLARRKFCPDEKDSNVLAQLAIFRGVRDMSNDERRLNGVFVKAYHQANDRRRLLTDSLKGKVNSLQSSGKSEDILRAICSGMVDHLYKSVGYGDWQNGDETVRKQAREELQFSGDWLIGLPFDIEIQGRRGRMMLRLVTMTTNVNPAMLVEVAPQLSKIVEGVNSQYNFEKDVCVSTRQTFFNDMLVNEEVLETPEHPSAAEVFGSWLVNQLYYDNSIVGYDFMAADSDIRHRAAELNRRAGETIFVYPSSRSEWQEFVSSKIGSAKCLTEIKVENFLLPAIDAELEAKILADNPDIIIINGEEISVDYNSNQPFISINVGLAKNQTGVLTLPSGRQLKLYVDSYNSFNSFDEVKAYYENKRLEEAWLAKQDQLDENPWLEGEENFSDLLKILSPIEYGQKENGEKVYAFPFIALRDNRFRLAIRKDAETACSENINAIKIFLGKEVRLEEESPWYNWGWTALANNFQKESSEIMATVVKANGENFCEFLGEIKERLSSLKNSLLSEHNSVRILFQETEENFYNLFFGQSSELVSEEVKSFQVLMSEAKTAFSQALLVEAKEKINEAGVLSAGLVNLLQKRQTERNDLVKANNVPAYLLKAFGNDVKRALQFMANVENLPANKIDAHEISCGRARVRTHLEEIGGPDFFNGADPNDVKYYVSDYYFGNEPSYEEPAQSQNIGPNDAIAEALRRAGLIE